MGIGTAVTAALLTLATGLAEHLAADATTQGRLVAITLAQSGATVLADIVAGPWVLAGAIGVSAWDRDGAALSVGSRARRLWGAYVLVRLALALGIVLVVPGLLVFVAALFFLDPVAGTEQSGAWFRSPDRARVARLAPLLVAVVGVFAAWNLFATVPLLNAGAPGRVLGYGLYEGLYALVLVAWCRICRGG